ncbi:GMC oxidoreductase [Mycobacterium heidelbergense]|uniref:GMC oxidoreductase n=1 Tax=Mycobacterium heidelbergense TaxID=53376 RepID=UPI003CF38793
MHHRPAAARTALNFANVSGIPRAPWRKAEIAPGPAAATRNALRAFVRQAVGTYHHQVATCKMGAADDPNAVVQPDLRVYGAGR